MINPRVIVLIFLNAIFLMLTLMLLQPEDKTQHVEVKVDMDEGDEYTHR